MLACLLACLPFEESAEGREDSLVPFRGCLLRARALPSSSSIAATSSFYVHTRVKKRVDFHTFPRDLEKG